MTGPGALGAEVDLSPVRTPRGKEIRADALLFGESASRVVVSVEKDRLGELESLAEAGQVRFLAAGGVWGNRSPAFGKSSCRGL